MQSQSLMSFETFIELRDYIHRTLCKLEQLEMRSFPLTQQVLRRGEEICGYLFSIYGPRSIVFNAVWETDRNSIHFYGSSGEKVLTTPLEAMPRLTT